MNFKQFYQISERTIGLTKEEISYVDILMQKIKNHCVPELWELGYAGLNKKSNDSFHKSGHGLVIHDFDEEPFPNLRISIYAVKKTSGSYLNDPITSSFPIKINMSPLDYPSDMKIFNKSLKGRSIIEILVPFGELPELLSKNHIAKFVFNLVRKHILPKVDDLRNTLEHELIHFKDPSIKIKDKREVPTTIRYDDKARGYYTSGGEFSGGVPAEFYPRIWTIIRNCEQAGDKKELLDWIKSPVAILPKCMEKESEFIKYTWENPSLRRFFLKKLYDGLVGHISPGKQYGS
jgi:hypothetical protein